MCRHAENVIYICLYVIAADQNRSEKQEQISWCRHENLDKKTIEIGILVKKTAHINDSNFCSFYADQEGLTEVANQQTPHASRTYRGFQAFPCPW